MGSPVSAALVNLYMEFLEELALNTAPATLMTLEEVS